MLDAPGPAAVVAAPVTVTFLGGLGEIGRNCVVLEFDGQLLLLDCGLMFPDADMPGIDLVLPDFTWLRENADRIDRLHRHPRPRGPRRRPVVPAPRAVVPDLRLRAHARPGPQPHRGGRAARPHRADPRASTASAARSGRSTSSSSPSPTRCRTASPPRSTRRRARSCTPATGSSTSPRSTAASPTSPASARSPTTTGRPAPARRLHQRRQPRPLAQRDERRRGALRPLPRARGPAHRHRLLRQPHPPHPADRRRRDRVRPHGRHARPVDEEERAAGPRDGPAAHPRARRSSTSRTSATSPTATSASSPPAARASRCRRWPSWPPARTAGSRSAPSDTVILSSHPIPGNEINVSKVIDGLVRLGAEVVHSGIADVHATGHAKQEELKTLLSIAEPEWFVPGARRVPPPRRPRRAGPDDGRARRRTPAVRGRRPARDRRRRRPRRPGRCRPATSTSTASSATSATACCATGGCWPRRAWSWSSSPSTLEDGAIITGPEIITRGWVYAPEAEDLLDECAAVVRQAVKEAFAEAAPASRARDPAARRAPRPPAASSTTAPSASR